MKIKIKDFKLKTNLGIYGWEKNFEREIIINLELEIKDSQALQSDKIEDTVDYELIYNQIKQLIFSKKFNLIERMAQEIVDLIMLDSRINKCKIEIDKMNIFEEVRSCAVSLESKRN
ncbi:7,8-dihydroneopterin aldolase [Alphaproteobacteria bacterium]|nr:7,8-dihydroneopterin aldolase [Alphaproteobacteria bacterium]